MKREKLNMIKLQSKIRLTPKEIKQLSGITGSNASYIKNTIQLNNYIDAHLVNYPGRTAEERLLKSMLESFKQ